MKLTDLHPRWIGAGGEGVFDAEHNPMPERHGVGIILDCPCGNSEHEHRLFVPFRNPLDGGEQLSNQQGWERTGETFEDLTLSPSIHRIGGCAWHGWIRNGEIINA
jgi:hypothetical protein